MTYTPGDLPLIDTFDWDSKIRDLVPVKKRPKGRLDEGRLYVSAEEGDGFADYYGEFCDNGGDPYIDPALEAWAEERGMYWDWVNPGEIVLVN